MSLLRALVVAALAIAWNGAGTAQTRHVDLNLVLAVDSSSSVTMDEYYLQIEGYARAFVHPELWRAIREGAQGAIAVALFEWSGPRQQILNFEWRLLDSEAALGRFAAELSLAPRLVIGGDTAIGDALLFAVALLDTAPMAATRQVIDVSGDGTSNGGTPLAAARALALGRGATVNGLAVVNEVPDLERYYRAEVAGGPGSFVLAARDYDDFRDVILRKLLREIGLISSLQGRGD